MYIHCLFQQKWHIERRNVRVDDIVVMNNNNVLRGKWSVGRIVEVFPDKMESYALKGKNSYRNL